MNNKIYVFEDRHLSIEKENFGVTTENNAEILNFTFPETINGEQISSYTKTVYFSDGTNKYSRVIQSDGTVKLDSGLTAKEQLTFWVEVTGDNFKWISFPYDIYFEFVGSDLPPAPEDVRIELTNDLRLALISAIGYELSEDIDHEKMTGETIPQIPVDLQSALTEATGETVTGSTFTDFTDFIKTEVKETYTDFDDLLTGMEEILNEPEN